MLYYAGMGRQPAQDYGKMSAVKWSFGSRFYPQYITDLRYHACGIAESRSKLSLLFWRRCKKLMLHQGFHTVAERESGKVYDMEWARESRVACKTIVHQKILFTLLNPPQTSKLMGYFPRTASNVAKLKEMLTKQNTSSLSSLDSLQTFYGTLYMPSWTLNGKIIYVQECLLEPDIDSLMDEYEFLRVSTHTFQSLTVTLHRFAGMNVIRLNRQRMYIQLRNLAVC